MGHPAMPAIEQVVSALSTLYTNPDRAAKEGANAWLSNFQKGDEAWATSQLILFAPDAPLETKLFAAQTFRSKVMFDLDALPEAQRLPLRDSLLRAFRSAATGTRAILTQVCIAVADLALQLTPEEWEDPVTSMIEEFGSQPEMAPALLEWLQVLAEEYNGNFKLNVRRKFGREGRDAASGKEASQVVALLSMYIQAQGVTTKLQTQCFACLGAWLRTGQAQPSVIAGTPLLQAAFQALEKDELFDQAVDALVDLIHETQELDDNMVVIQDLMPRLFALRPLLERAMEEDDSDKTRGICRILVEAGEWYVPLIARHPDSFLPLVEEIALCSAFSDLDVVTITLNFWYRLTAPVRHNRDDPAFAPLVQVFANLVETVIRHLHYPADGEQMAGQEKDDFRSFRHSIGDTLKDCCAVLGAAKCLKRSYDIISAAAAGQHTWQDLEAPLFSMRTMGAEVDVRDDEIMPAIMNLIPQLPNHPKIRYAALLVQGRYTEWINYHPSYVESTLTYISSSFETEEQEVRAAAAQGLKYLCKDAAEHLVPYLPQLHSFLQAVSTKLLREDLLDITSAVAHVISGMPDADAAQALQMFCAPNLEVVHALLQSGAPATRQAVVPACDALDRLDMLIGIGGPVENLPESCRETCKQVWGILDQLLEKYGQDVTLAEKACIVIRRGMQFFGLQALEVAPSVLERIVACFERHPSSGYLWITGKIAHLPTQPGELSMEGNIQKAFEKETAIIVTLLQGTAPQLISDLLDDYVRLATILVNDIPDALILSSALVPAFQITLACLTSYTPQIVISALDVVRGLIGHEALLLSTQPESSSPQAAAYATAITSLIEASGDHLVSLLLKVLVSDDEDVTVVTTTLFRILSLQFPAILARGVPPALAALESKSLSDAEKAQFLEKFQTSMADPNRSKVKDSFTWLLRTAKKANERARLLERPT